MKSFLLASTVAALGAAVTTSEAIVLPKGSNLRQYDQHPKLQQNVPRAAGGGIKIDMYQHNKRDMNDVEQTIAFAQRQRDYVLRKWGKSERANEARAAAAAKRQVLGLSDVGQDNFYFGQVSVGTPKQNFNVILDTGSADFWLADTNCNDEQCEGVALFDTGASSTYKGSDTPFEIRYGTGAVQGTLAADTVSLAGYTVNSQTFAIAEQLAPQSLNAPTSGIMGLGFQSLAQSQSTPFWQVLAEQNKLQDDLFTFQLARNVRTAASTDQVNPGGVFTLGKLDSAQYDGDVNYVPLTGAEGYWTIPLQAVTVNGQRGTISGDQTAAIDTGTTLILAPPRVASALYQSIPGAASLGGLFSSSNGYYSIPCNTNVNITMTFGGQSYAINSADMTSGAVDNQGNCLGGILGESLGTGAPGFIVGDVFLKNVFSVYRYEPAAVGFAALKGQAAQTVATTSAAITSTGGATGSPTSASSSSAQDGNLPPLFSSVAQDESDSSIAAGSGLPAPTAVGTGSSSSPDLTPAVGVDSNQRNNDTSGSAPSIRSLTLGSGACLVAFVLGAFAVL